MSSDAPALSAIIISLNDEATIARCVRAVVEQECPEPFEVIVVTSGHDRTAAIVREQFPQVTLIELPAPALPGAARNAGLRVARGAYITFPGSHIELFPGSLAARLRAHRLGYPMVTGAAMNGTQTLAGWASYFLDHSTHLPGQPPRVLRDPPVTCSYAREPLLALGGFPEDLRTGEDTTVNLALARAGYTAYQDPQIRFIHYSPCRTPWQLVRHHFTRGRGAGRLLMERYRRERTESGIRPATVGRTLADGLGVGRWPRAGSVVHLAEPVERLTEPSGRVGDPSYEDAAITRCRPFRACRASIATRPRPAR